MNQFKKIAFLQQKTIVHDPFHVWDTSFRNDMQSAAMDGRTDTVEFLLSVGCEPDPFAIQYAARDNHKDTLKALLEAGGKLDPKLEPPSTDMRPSIPGISGKES